MTDEITMAFAAKEAEIRELTAQRDELARQVGVLTTDDKGWRIFCLDNGLQASKEANDILTRRVAELEAGRQDNIKSSFAAGFICADGDHIEAQDQAEQYLSCIDSKSVVPGYPQVTDRIRRQAAPISDDQMAAAHEELDNQPATVAVPERLTDRHRDVIRMALFLFHSQAMRQADAAARDKDGQWFAAGDVDRFLSDAKTAEEARALLAAAPKPAPVAVPEGWSVVFAPFDAHGSRDCPFCGCRTNARAMACCNRAVVESLRKPILATAQEKGQ